MMTFKSVICTSVLALTLIPSAALAHTAGGETSGFVHGLAHPVSGLDHILAMVMVGLFAHQLGGRAMGLVPTTFVLVMAVGGALGVAGINIPFVEIGIALSVVVFGATVALGAKAPTMVAMGIVGLFAVFHGHAHGVEVPKNAGVLAYAAGFIIATAILHSVGIGIGFLIGKIGEQYGSGVVRASGGVAAVAGVGILAGIL